MAECECLCARTGCGRVGFFFPESMTRHFLHPASAPDYGQNAQPCLAVLSDDGAQDAHWPSVNGADCARERSCATGR